MMHDNQYDSKYQDWFSSSIVPIYYVDADRFCFFILNHNFIGIFDSICMLMRVIDVVMQILIAFAETSYP